MGPAVNEDDLVILDRDAEQPERRFAELAAAWLYTHRSWNTRSAYESDLAHFAAWCTGDERDPMTVDDQDLARYRDACVAAGSSPATVSRRLSALASFYRHAEDNEEVDNNPADGVDRPEPSDGDGGNVLDEADRAALFAAAGERNPKTASLVGLLLLDGVKLGEALCADAGHFSDPPGALNVKRRGRVQRVPVCAATVAAIHSYLAARTTGPLFLSDTRGREDQRLTRSGAHYLLKQAGAAAGMSRPVSANTLRRSYVTDAHDAGVAVEDIQASVGHYDRRTTLRLLPDDTHVEHDEP